MSELIINLAISLLILLLKVSGYTTYRTAVNFYDSKRLNSYGDSTIEFDKYRVRLGIDYSPSYIGIALSNFLGQINPLTTLNNESNQTIICQQILNICANEKVIEIVVGIPVDSNGIVSYNIKNFNGKLCLKFSSLLATLAMDFNPSLRVYLFDERYTTKEAKLRLSKRGGVASSIDAMSAVCLLERFSEDEADGSIVAKTLTGNEYSSFEIFDYNDVRKHIQQLYYNDNDDSIDSINRKKSTNIFKRKFKS